MIRTFLPAASVVLLLSSCTGGSGDQAADNGYCLDCFTTCRRAVPNFNADTAYDYVAKQVAFGPRTPGSDAQVNVRIGWKGSCALFATPFTASR